MDDAFDVLQRRAAADPRVIGLGGGLPSEAQFPRRALASAFLRVVAQRGAPALQYGWPEGIERLRAGVAARLRERGADVEPREVLITNGAQQAIDLAVQLSLRRGQSIAVDGESYPAALDLFRERGLVPAARPRRPAAAYVMPAVGNPHGVAMSTEQRARVLEAGIPIIEDDAYAELRWEGQPARPLLAEARDRVFHVGTFSKTLAPGLRVGWLVPPRRLLRRALHMKQSADLQPGSLAQAILDDFLERDDFAARLVKLRRFYRRRASLLAAAVRRHLPRWRLRFPEGGFALWLEPDGEAPELLLLRRAIAEGVSFDPGSMFRPDCAQHPLGVRLCFSAAPAEAFDEGVRRLARAWTRVAAGRRA